MIAACKHGFDAVLLRGLGMGDEQIRERFGESETMMGTLEKDHTKTEEDALVEIYRRLRPGEPPSAESGRLAMKGVPELSAEMAER